MDDEMNDILRTLRTQEDGPQSNVCDEEIGSSTGVESDVLSELDTSGTYEAEKVQFNFSQLDSELKVKDILKFDGYKIRGVFEAFIKRMNSYSNDVTVLELVDETGEIEANMPRQLENRITDNKVRISGFSLWKLGRIQINIVDENFCTQNR